MLTDTRMENMRKTYYFNYAQQYAITGFVAQDGTKVFSEFLSGANYIIDNTLPEDVIKTSKDR